jgi:hypothetical protein
MPGGVALHRQKTRLLSGYNDVLHVLFWGEAAPQLVALERGMFNDVPSLFHAG